MQVGGVTNSLHESFRGQAFLLRPHPAPTSQQWGGNACFEPCLAPRPTETSSTMCFLPAEGIGDRVGSGCSSGPCMRCLSGKLLHPAAAGQLCDRFMRDAQTAELWSCTERLQGEIRSMR